MLVSSKTGAGPGDVFLLYGPLLGRGAIDSSDASFVGPAEDVNGAPWCLGPGDINGDGRPDVVIPDPNYGTYTHDTEHRNGRLWVFWGRGL